MAEWLEPEKWYAGLPSFLASATALITDRAGAAILAVKPNYRPHWNLPGGIMDAGEPPHLCCAREVGEELGIDLHLGRPLVLDWAEPTAIRKAWFGYVFDGGTLDDPAQLTLQDQELDDVAFIEHQQVRSMFTSNTADRIHAALQARANGGVAYLHNGQVVTEASSGAWAARH